MESTTHAHRALVSTRGLRRSSPHFVDGPVCVTRPGWIVAWNLLALSVTLLTVQDGLSSPEAAALSEPDVLRAFEDRARAFAAAREDPASPDGPVESFARHTHGFGGQSLQVSPALGFLFAESGCCGSWLLNLGPARWEDGRLVLAPRFEPVDPTWGTLSAVLLPVRWGERRYLVGLDQLDRFVNAVNLGTFTEHSRWLWIERGGDDHPLAGWPELPGEHARHLLARPVDGSVVESRWLTDTDARGRWECSFDLRLDQGAARGLWKGMQVRLVEGLGAFELAEVVEVEAGSARALVRCRGHERHPAPAPGWHWSSRAE